MTLVVINKNKGFFKLSKKAIAYLEEHESFKTEREKWELNYFKKNGYNYLNDFGLKRDNPFLLDCVKSLKEQASNPSCDLQIVLVDGTLDKDFFIGDYEGIEKIFYSKEEAEIYSQTGYWNEELNISANN